MAKGIRRASLSPPAPPKQFVVKFNLIAQCPQADGQFKECDGKLAERFKLGEDVVDYTPFNTFVQRRFDLVITAIALVSASSENLESIDPATLNRAKLTFRD
ncbi:hypothetical protein CSOJ01_10614 [Colletotrichum sojae]|uniref:Uncharacterized protein n=1 Tax=Colletotrichum sojae TaxID=2175907 RepID=A0A8H6IZW9_9PEZI|nr:hypothetical protein CSOJ01_10614 [Colletotrichum sojae]